VPAATLASIQGTGTVSLKDTSNAPVVLTLSQTTSGTYAGGFSGSGSVVKNGDSTLSLTGASTHTGTTSVQQGTLQVAGGAALGASTLAVANSATASVASYIVAGAGGLAIAADGLVDVTRGGMTAANTSAASVVTRLLEGRGDGSWNGTKGITSSSAAADLTQSLPRTVGWLDNGDGSVTFAYAGPGDTNLDWTVDILDAANFLSGGKFDSGTPATWNEGDFGYDGVVDILDAADFLSTGLFDAGPYNSAPGSVGEVAAVPEPSAAAAGLLAAAASLLLIRRRRSTV
jgi:autotransporter-associated beta strand protein